MDGFLLMLYDGNWMTENAYRMTQLTMYRMQNIWFMGLWNLMQDWYFQIPPYAYSQRCIKSLILFYLIWWKLFFIWSSGRRVNRFSTAAATEELIIPPVQIGHTQHLINGQFVDAASGNLVLHLTKIRSPAPCFSGSVGLIGTYRKYVIELMFENSFGQEKHFQHTILVQEKWLLMWLRVMQKILIVQLLLLVRHSMRDHGQRWLLM